MKYGLILVLAMTAENLRADSASLAIEDMIVAAHELESAARSLDSFAGNPQLTWRSHAAMLANIKADLREINESVKLLESHRATLEPRELAMLDRVAPHVREAAINANRAIAQLNERQGVMWAEPYRTSAARMALAAAELVRSLKAD